MGYNPQLEVNISFCPSHWSYMSYVINSQRNKFDLHMKPHLFIEMNNRVASLSFHIPVKTNDVRCLSTSNVRKNNAGDGVGYSQFYRGSGAGHWCSRGTGLLPHPFIVLLEYPSKNTRLRCLSTCSARKNNAPGNASINSRGAHPPRQLQGICSRCQSRGGVFTIL